MTLDSLPTLHVNSLDQIKQLPMISTQYDIQMIQITDFLSKMVRPITGQTHLSRAKQCSENKYFANYYINNPYIIILMLTEYKD